MLANFRVTLISLPPKITIERYSNSSQDENFKTRPDPAMFSPTSVNKVLSFLHDYDLKHLKRLTRNQETISTSVPHIYEILITLDTFINKQALICV